MPLRGKIVVIKRSGGDGTEFPLTATCLFGRKPDCDIRIQLPQVSKEHCRIDFNENKEVVLTNLSSVNPTLVNGEALRQAERLKHGDVITVIDRSFRFECPPASTPKKRSSRGGKLDTLKVLQDQRAGDKDKRVSEVSTDPLKDETNNHIHLEKTVLESQGGGTSPFSDLYQMIRQSLDVKTPRRSSLSLLQTPSSRLCTPKPAPVRPARQDDANREAGAAPPPSAKKKKRNSSPAPPTERRSSAAPEKLTVGGVVEQITRISKSPVRGRSKEITKAPESQEEAELLTASPTNSTEGTEAPKKRKSGELGPAAAAQLRRKRVSFGGQLSPELFDKRLPPDSPLRRGAAPRRSLHLLRPKPALLRRASAIGMLQGSPGRTRRSPAARAPSPKTATPEKKGQKSRSPAMKAATASPNAATPAKRSPKAATPATKSPNAATPATKSPRAATPATKSPRAATPATKSPRAATPATKSPKAATPATKSPKAACSSPETATPAKRSPKAATPATKSPRAATPATKSPRAASTSPRAATPSRTPRGPGVPTPAVQGRFSVSRIATPSPTASRKTPAVSRSAVKAIQRRSGISRASLKASNCWADIVKFGKPKTRVVAASHVRVPQKAARKAWREPRQKTPAGKLKGHASTGHADSPATVVVGRAHKRTATRPAGAAPRVIVNINVAPFRLNMRMDEDLSGIAEMFQTPVSHKRSAICASGAVATPAAMEPSLLNTPEESGEMAVSPLGVASAMKGRRYNSEAVQRLLSAGGPSSLVCVASPTPRLTSEVPDGPAGVGGVSTPRPEPVRDLRGDLLKTPRQKPEQQESLSAVKRILKTPKQKPQEVDCLSALKTVFQTPQQDVERQSLKTPEAPPPPPATGVLETPPTPQASPDPPEENAQVSEERPAPIRRAAKTPRRKNTPVEDMVGVKRIMGTPRVKGQPVEDDFGIKRLMRSPRGSGPVEDFQGLKELLEEGTEVKEELTEELMEEVTEEVTEELMEEVTGEVTEEPPPETHQAAPEQGGASTGLEVTPPSDQPSDDDSKVHLTQGVEALEEHLQSVPHLPDVPDVPEPPPEDLPAQQGAELEAPEENLQGTSSAAPVRGRRGRTAAAAPPAVRQLKRGRERKEEEEEEPGAAVRPRRGRKGPAEEEAAPAAESRPEEEPAPKPRRGRAAKLPEGAGPERRGDSPAEPAADAGDKMDAAEAQSSAAGQRKPARGRRAKLPEGAGPERQGDSPAEPAAEAAPSADAGDKMDAAGQRKPARGRRAKLPEGEEEEPAPKPRRGRRAKLPEGAEPERQGDSPAEPAADVCDEARPEPEVQNAAGQKNPARGGTAEVPDPADEPVRGRRGRAAAAAPPAVRQLKRGRERKEEEEEEPGAAVRPRRGRKGPAEEEAAPAAESRPEEEPAPKPRRGRAAKLPEGAGPERQGDSPAEPAADAGDKMDAAEAQSSAAGQRKPARGRRAKLPEGAEPERQGDSPAEPAADAGDKMDAAEAQSSAAGQRKPARGRRAKLPEEEEEEPVRGRRGRKVGAAAPPAVRQLKRGRNTKTQEDPSHRPAAETGPEESGSPEPAGGARPRRGATAKPGAPPAPAQAPEEKPKRVRRGRREDAPQDQAGTREPAAVPAKRPRRGAAAAAPPVGGGGSAEAAPPVEGGGSAEAPPPQDPSKAAKTSKSVMWDSELQVIGIPRAAGRGGGSKVGAGAGPLPGELPVKRSRRGARAADVSAAEEGPPETLPKARRGRAARK